MIQYNDLSTYICLNINTPPHPIAISTENYLEPCKRITDHLLIRLSWILTVLQRNALKRFVTSCGEIAAAWQQKTEKER
jgi:hypothetical protein